MSDAYATFAVAPATRAGGIRAGGECQVHRDFMDFVVDGRPLLLRFRDLDAVSPFTSDLPPDGLTAVVRSLLLEEDPPLPDGRHILYGCPECPGLECGAATAVIEADGDDYMWRDIAWQTSERADPERDGHHGTGPFRFRGAEYRAALTALLEGTTVPPRRRVLLIGARASVLRRLAAALRTIDLDADIAHDATGIPDGNLRSYGAVAFGRAIGEQDRAAVYRAFEEAGADVAYVDGLAPIVPLLVDQIEQALTAGPAEGRRLTGLAVTGGEAAVEVAAPCRVTLTAYRLDRLYRSHTHEVFDDVLQTGRHTVPLDPKAVKGEAFVVARATGTVLVEAATPGRRGGRTGRRGARSGG
ncbi:oxidoreductase [Streptomyces sp. NPDC051207]|uniref:oxidoreductase n=1 Tax=Streptomyces sp. NPDC051207 TaxID=3154641 RepID=UPI0034168712